MGVAEDLQHTVNLSQPRSIPSLVLSKSLLVGVSIAQITIGAKYLKECTVQNYIPVYVLVSGVFHMIMALFACLPCGQNDNSTLKTLSSIWNSLLSGFTICWFIAGSVWVYSIYPPNYNSTVVDVPYCNKTLYLFAFWTTTLVYILFAVVIVGTCCCVVYMCVCKSEDQPEQVTPA